MDGGNMGGVNEGADSAIERRGRRRWVEGGG